MGLHLEKEENIRIKGIHDKIKLQLLEIILNPFGNCVSFIISEPGNPNKTQLSNVNVKILPFSRNVDWLLIYQVNEEIEREAHHAS